MALMLAAEEKGLGSCPLIGFDPAGVAGVLGLSARYVPAMIITVGPLADGNMGRKHRLPVADLLRVNSGF
jgi:nitroreductase